MQEGAQHADSYRYKLNAKLQTELREETQSSSYTCSIGSHSDKFQKHQSQNDCQVKQNHMTAFTISWHRKAVLLIFPVCFSVINKSTPIIFIVANDKLLGLECILEAEDRQILIRSTTSIVLKAPTRSGTLFLSFMLSQLASSNCKICDKSLLLPSLKKGGGGKSLEEVI